MEAPLLASGNPLTVSLSGSSKWRTWNGPAVVNPDGTQDWWVDGKCVEAPAGT